MPPASGWNPRVSTDSARTRPARSALRPAGTRGSTQASDPVYSTPCMVVTRRKTLGGLGVVVAAGLIPRWAEATTARGLTLEVLSKKSQHIVVGTPLDSVVRYETIAGQKRIVTETRFGIDDEVASAPGDSEILVRTLGGILDGVGELVHGEAQLVLNERSVVFLHARADGVLWLQGMAQGHYPLRIES